MPPAAIDYAAQRRAEAARRWAGVRHTNLPSIAVVSKLALTEFERLPHWPRYRLQFEEGDQLT
jgi:hypothetical protein